ncbi:precorrin-2 C20-methyltransferase [Devosia lucknowensis]|uniref:Precorrin-2 C20-methyltransferase n=1 Tax=Devosia lucknowensis TaxID=1096929 RepID=A0A1Y6EHV2_9HYPH|nr:precorrin-2 C(20)-methyltransferase [Devosia lucknowensis]SMQ60500.1 precorrin-2 C20-methyltransferase [Devosia lucknowensis]
MSGKLIGVGTGPGDPDLLTLKAAKAIAGADVVAYFAKRGNPSNARGIAAGHFRDGQIEEALDYPVTTEIHRHDHGYKSQIQDFYAEAAERIATHIEAGRTVAVLSEGDPLFYGSYMHLHVRLAPRYDTEVIPGITAMSGCWSAAGLPLVQGDDVLTVLPGTLDQLELQRRLSDTEGAVIMKLGRNLPKVRAALAAVGRLDGAVYVERGTMENAASQPMVGKVDDNAPYFSLVLVPGWSARP